MFKAKDKRNPKKYVAMKKILMDNEKEGVSLFFQKVSKTNISIYFLICNKKILYF